MKKRKFLLFVVIFLSLFFLACHKPVIVTEKKNNFSLLKESGIIIESGETSKSGGFSDVEIEASINIYPDTLVSLMVYREELFPNKTIVLIGAGSVQDKIDAHPEIPFIMDEAHWGFNGWQFYNGGYDLYPGGYPDFYYNPLDHLKDIGCYVYTDETGLVVMFLGPHLIGSVDPYVLYHEPMHLFSFILGHVSKNPEWIDIMELALVNNELIPYTRPETQTASLFFDSVENAYEEALAVFFSYHNLGRGEEFFGSETERATFFVENMVKFTGPDVCLTLKTSFVSGDIHAGCAGILPMQVKETCYTKEAVSREKVEEMKKEYKK